MVSERSALGHFLAGWFKPSSVQTLARIDDYRLDEYVGRITPSSEFYLAIRAAIDPPTSPRLSSGERYVSVAQVSDYTGLGQTKVRRLLRSGDLRGTRRPNRPWAVEWSSVLQFLEAKEY